MFFFLQQKELIEVIKVGKNLCFRIKFPSELSDSDSIWGASGPLIALSCFRTLCHTELMSVQMILVCEHALIVFVEEQPSSL